MEEHTDIKTVCHILLAKLCVRETACIRRSVRLPIATTTEPFQLPPLRSSRDLVRRATRNFVGAFDDPKHRNLHVEGGMDFLPKRRAIPACTIMFVFQFACSFHCTDVVHGCCTIRRRLLEIKKRGAPGLPHSRIHLRGRQIILVVNVVETAGPQCRLADISVVSRMPEDPHLVQEAGEASANRETARPQTELLLGQTDRCVRNLFPIQEGRDPACDSVHASGKMMPFVALDGSRRDGV